MTVVVLPLFRDFLILWGGNSISKYRGEQIQRFSKQMFGTKYKKGRNGENVRILDKAVVIVLDLERGIEVELVLRSDPPARTEPYQPFSPPYILRTSWLAWRLYFFQNYFGRNFS